MCVRGVCASCCCPMYQLFIKDCLVGNDLVQYRAAIGAFYAVTHKLIRASEFKLNLLFQLYCAINICCILSLRCVIKNDEFTLYRLILLIICMDIHLNPGPASDTINSLDILHLNIRSIRNKIDYISEFSDTHQILCFKETHLDNTVDADSLKIEGYDEPLRKDRRLNGGGIMVYISSSLIYKRRLDLENIRLETIWVEIKLKSFNLLLCCFYRSDFFVSQPTFITDLQSSIEEALDYSQYVILLGDINIDFLNLRNVQLADCLYLFSLRNVINVTRVSDTASSLIDPVIVSDSCDVLDSGVLAVDNSISDHRATYLSLKIDLNLCNNYYRKVWNYKHADYIRLNELIEQFNWNDVFDSNDVDDICNKFTSVFLGFCKSCIPYKQILIRENDKPWFNSEIRYNIRLRDKLRKKSFKTKSTQDLLLYKRQRNKVNNMKKYAKENYINNISETISNYENGNSNKTFWQIMGRFMGKSCCSTKIPPLRTYNNEYAYTNEEKSEVLNNFFCTVSTIDDANVNLPNFELRTNNTLSNINILQSEVIDILNLLKVNKAIGPDGISHRMLKYTSKTISVPLTKLFNLSLEQNIYPCLWKVAHVMPLYKKGDKSEAGNYRPVSLISCVGKAFERVIFKHVYNHIADNNLLYKYQSGFLPRHSTVHHLIEIIHQTCLALENYETSCHIFCDISKAFDRVWHRGLIVKLEKYGITGNLLTWFQNYLTMRNQMVFVNGVEIHSGLEEI